VGFFALWEKGLDSRTVVSDLNIGFPFVRNNDNRIDNWTWAPYGQVTWDAFDWLSLTGGLRYTEDKKGADVRITDPTRPDVPPELDTGNSAVFASWTPMGSIALRAPEDWLDAMSLDHSMGYFTYARGFKGGGFNAVFNPTAEGLDGFAPETLDSFEIGLKTIGFDQRVTFNASFFLGKYDDIQVTSVRDLTGPGDDVPNIIQLTQNAAQATTKGAELELVALPTSGMRLDGSVGLLDTKYDSFPNAIDDVTGARIDRAGQTLMASPELQTHVSVQYSFEVGFEGPAWLQGWLTPRLDWYYQSFMHFQGPEVTATNQRGYNLLHARLSYDFLDDRAQVALWSQNLTNQEYLAFGLTSVVSSWGVGLPYYASPRTFGAEISYRL
jgi:iron complex outermembrane receptor protein